MDRYKEGYADCNREWKDRIEKRLTKLRKRETEIYKLDYQLEPEKAIDCLLLRINDLENLLKKG